MGKDLLSNVIFDIGDANFLKLTIVEKEKKRREGKRTRKGRRKQSPKYMTMKIEWNWMLNCFIEHHQKDSAKSQKI